MGPVLPREDPVVHAEQGDDPRRDAAHGEHGAEGDPAGEKAETPLLAGDLLFEPGADYLDADGVGKGGLLPACVETVDHLSQGRHVPLIVIVRGDKAG